MPEIPASQRDAVLKQLGANVRRLRVRADIASDKLAEKAGMDRKFVGEIERGTSNPTATSLLRLATALDVPVAAFFDGVELGSE